MKKKEEPFKPHDMYKDGVAVKANTVEEHLALKSAGYGHDKPKKVIATMSFKEAVNAAKSFLDAVESQMK
jgi:hypothetical protein|tara:strand:+ start:491 stop:700 length:210 start_codon:yes stop_codon:yes gene_type:complete